MKKAINITQEILSKKSTFTQSYGLGITVFYRK